MGKYTELNDLELFKRISKYDSRAIEELYNRYSTILFTLIKKIVPTQETAEYILVEVFSIVWRKIEKFDFDNGNVYTWLITLARNRAVDSIKRDRGLSLEHYDDAYEDFFIIPSLSNDIDKMDLSTARSIKPQIENALAKLTDAQKYVIHLAFYEGYSLDEIAKELNIPIETVRSKVLTALQNLRDNLLTEGE